MRQYFIIAVFLMTLALCVPKGVLGSPMISSVRITPSSSLWIGESPTISVNCTDDTYAIQNVTVQITGQDGYTIPTENLNFQNGQYVAAIDPLYFTKPNLFTANFTCTDSNSESFNQITTFSVSNFSTSISTVSPTSIYVGNQIEIDLSVNQNTNPISPASVGYDVSKYPTFSILLNNNPVTPKVSPVPYDPAKGWIIYLDAPSSAGTYGLQITTNFNRVNDTESASLAVGNQIQFNILAVDKTWVKQNDTVNVQIQAFDKGGQIALNTNDLSLTMGSTQVPITSITQVSNYYNVAFTVPTLSSNSYSLTASLTYKGNAYTSSWTMYYILIVSGEMQDQNQKGIPVDIQFSQNGAQVLRLYTDSNGDYSGTLPPGIYDIRYIFPMSTLYLYGVNLNSYNDPVKYSYLTSADIPGMDTAALHFYGAALSFSNASLEMKYDENNVVNEDNLTVFRCDNWNAARAICNSYWQNISSTIDKVRNVVYVPTAGLSAYAIGTLKQLYVQYGLDKSTYNLADSVELKGQVVDANKNPIKNATVLMSVRGTPINISTYSDDNGVFTIDFISPNAEGNYPVQIFARSPPALDFNTYTTLSVARSKDFSIVFPDTIRLNAGDTNVQGFDLVNIGQADLSGLKMSLVGIPSDYYTFNSNIGTLKNGETKRVSISFSIPVNATAGTYSATLTVSNSDISRSKIFGFTVSSENQTASSPQGISSSGFFSKIEIPSFAFPTLDMNTILVIIFAAVCFSLAYVLKKIRLKGKKTYDMRNSLLDIKDRLKRKGEDNRKDN